jgi:quinol monooxygenase YgiN
MPTLRWTKGAATPSGPNLVAMASHLPLRRHRSIPSFLKAALAIRRQLRHTEGLVGYALDADLVHAVFWTASVWESQDALDRFARSDPHRRLTSSIDPLMAPTTFTFWDQPSTEVPVQWDLARQKLSQVQADNVR